jgi:hypothetical protein
MLTKTIPHTFIRNGYYYFSRRVPSDLRDHYSYHRIVQGLRTTSPQKAKVQASITSAKLEAYWNQMRLAKSDVIGMSLVKEPSSGSLKVDTKQPQSDCPTLLDALEVYLAQKGGKHCWPGEMVMMKKLGRPIKETEAVNVRLEIAMIEKLDNARRSESDLPTRPEMLRRIFKDWLEQTEKTQK